MQRDPATQGRVIILFAIAVMIFGLTTGNVTIAGVAGIVGIVVAVLGLVTALGGGPRT
jgi:hypothetical protein